MIETYNENSSHRCAVQNINPSKTVTESRRTAMLKRINAFSRWPADRVPPNQ